MTIQEAIKSDRPFRRSEDTVWYDQCKMADGDTLVLVVYDTDTGYQYVPSVNDILANDWETKE